MLCFIREYIPCSRDKFAYGMILLSEGLEPVDRSVSVQGIRWFLCITNPNRTLVLPASMTYPPSIQEWAILVKNCLKYQPRLPAPKQPQPLPYLFFSVTILPEADAPQAHTVQGEPEQP